MKYKQLIFALIIFNSCKPEVGGLLTITQSRNEIVDNKTQIVSETVKTLRMSDRLPVTMLTRVFNYNNDKQVKYLTGLTKKDGLQDYLLDSIYYDKMGNDTLKKSFVYIAKEWQPIQIIRKEFRKDNKVVYYRSETNFKKENYFKREIYYKYNADGQILSETNCETTNKTKCDSVSKKKFIYHSTKKLDKKISFIWKKNKWIELKTTGESI